MTEALPAPELRAQVIDAVQRLAALGLNRGSTGNVSVRADSANRDANGDAHGDANRDANRDANGSFWITPTGMGASGLTADDLVWMGDAGEVRGAWQPSSEWPFHRAIYQARADLHAVVHVHSAHATALACLRRELPAFHYMVAVAGGVNVPCTPYHLFGSDALSRAVATAFSDRNACLMANHGLVAGGTSIEHALKVVVEIESLCQTYLEALAAGEPALLTAEEMAAVIEKFRTYGRSARAAAPGPA